MQICLIFLTVFERIGFVFNLHKYDHITYLSMSFELISSTPAPIDTCINSLFFPKSSYLILNFSSYLGRSSNNLLLHYPTHRSEFVQSTFLKQFTLLWNALPLEIKMAKTQQTFKYLLQKHFINALSDLP